MGQDHPRPEESRPSEEGQRFREREDRGEQAYDPFHRKCRRNVSFLDKNLIATRETGWSGGMIFEFSTKPIPLGGMFQVKVLEIQMSAGCFGSLVSHGVVY